MPDPIHYADVALAEHVYGGTDPDGFTNGKVSLLLDLGDSYGIYQADYFTRLLFTEPAYLSRSFDHEGGTTSVAELLRGPEAEDPTVWKNLGLPGLPLCIGVNAAVRIGPDSELLAFKKAGGAGGLGHSVGPGVSGSLKLPAQSGGALPTLADVVRSGIERTLERELAQPTESVVRRGAWRDSVRGEKPEVSYIATLGSSKRPAALEALTAEHAGVLELSGHLSEDGSLLPDAEQALTDWGLNAQAWMPWS